MFWCWRAIYVQVRQYWVSTVVQAGLTILGNWTTTQKTRQICHRIIEFFVVILLIFWEVSESEWEFLFFLPGKKLKKKQLKRKKSHSDSDPSQKMSNITLEYFFFYEIFALFFACKPLICIAWNFDTLQRHGRPLPVGLPHLSPCA